MCFVCTVSLSLRGFAMGQVNTVLSLPTSEVQVIRSYEYNIQYIMIHNEI